MIIERRSQGGNRRRREGGEKDVHKSMIFLSLLAIFELVAKFLKN